MNFGTKFKVAAVQMDCEIGNVESNLAKAKKLIDKAIKKEAKVIVLPELFNTGYRVEENDSNLSETLYGNTIKWMHKIAETYDIVLIAAIIEKIEVEGVFYDTAVIVDKTGLINKYRKVYLWDQENTRFKKGDEYYVENNGEIKIGLQICYEIGFPEGARLLALQGANILVYPSAFGKKRFYAWDIASRARALENGCYLIASNRIGIEKNETEFGGRSRIVSPRGEVLQELGGEEGVIVSEIDLESVIKQRLEIPYLRDLNYRLYTEEK